MLPSSILSRWLATCIGGGACYLIDSLLNILHLYSALLQIYVSNKYHFRFSQQTEMMIVVSFKIVIIIEY